MNKVGQRASIIIVLPVKTADRPAGIGPIAITPMEIDPTGLLDYQVPAARQLLAALESHGAALDGSDMGVGKTFTAGAVLRARDVPTLVVGPMISETGWKRMGAKLGVEFSYAHYEWLRTGNSPFGWWEYPRPARLKEKLVCNSCQCVVNLSNQKCPHHHLGIHCVEVKKIPHRHGKFIWHPGIKQLVFDEVHRCGATDSLHADMLIAARRQGIPTLALSATAAESPLQLRALGFVLSLHGLVDRGQSPGFWRWATANGCQKLPFGGFEFCVGAERKKQILSKIHGHIFPERGVRIRVADLGDAFPECQLTAELLDIAQPERINRLYREMADSIAAVHEKRDADGETGLVALLRARQELELLKCPVLEEMAADAMVQGLHVAIFVNFRATVDELCKRLKTDCRVDGSQIGASGATSRQKNIDNFQADKEPVIILTSAAGGVSIDLHDVRGEFPRLGLISLGQSAVEFRQITGRLCRSGGLSKSFYRVILAAKTVEESVHKKLSEHLNNLDALVDGDLLADNLPLTYFPNAT